MVEIQHTCPDDSEMGLHSVCPGTSDVVGASDIFILIAVVVVLAAVGFTLWNISRRRFSEEVGDEEEE